MSDAATIEIVALAEKMLIPLASKATGLPIRSMIRCIENGLWTEGKEYEVGEDRNVRMILSGYYAWVKSGRRAQVAKGLIDPAPEVETQLCRHFDGDGALLYVGVSLFSVHRLAQHRSGSRWADRIASITIEKLPSRAQAFMAETAAIINEKPLFNIAKVPAAANDL